MATYQSVNTSDVIDVTPHLDRAERALDAARLLAREGFAEDAVARAHQSTIHAERALLATEKRSPPDMNGVHRLATNHFHQPELVDGKHCRRIETLAAARARCDAQSEGASDETEAQEAVTWAAEFLADVQRWLNEAGYTGEPS